MGHANALPKIMDLSHEYAKFHCGGFYNRRTKLHIRREALEWFVTALCKHGAELNLILGWNAGHEGNPPPEVEFADQASFLQEFCDV